MTFQSSPGVRAGCDREGFILTAVGMLFQSSPGVRAGCDTSCACLGLSR